MCAVDAVWPHVGVVAVQLFGAAVVPESNGACRADSQPVTTGRVGTEKGVVVPGVDGAHADGMQHLMEQGTRLLVGRVGTHSHPSTVAAVGGRGVGAIADVHIESTDSRIFVP